MQTDPVCKMQVDEKTAAGKSEYHGEVYYFCSEQCKQDFERNPEAYVKRRTSGQH